MQLNWGVRMLGTPLEAAALWVWAPNSSGGLNCLASLIASRLLLWVGLNCLAYWMDHCILNLTHYLQNLSARRTALFGWFQVRCLFAVFCWCKYFYFFSVLQIGSLLLIFMPFWILCFYQGFNIGWYCIIFWCYRYAIYHIISVR